MQIDPKYAHHQVVVTCSCKNTFNLSFIKGMPEAISIERCNKCHPAYNEYEAKTNDRSEKVAKFLEKCGDDLADLF